MIRLTSHAVTRYQERVKPALSFDQASAELERLVKGRHPERTAPDWFRGVPADAYLEVCDGIVLPLNRSDRGYLVATTVMCRCGHDSEHRAERNARKARRKRARAVARKAHTERARSRQAARESGPRSREWAA